MPKHAFPADAEGMFNRSQIMSRAWQRVRHTLKLYRRAYNLADMADALRAAWAEARSHVQPADPDAFRAKAIRYELATLSTRSFQQDIEPLRRKLEAELSGLAA